MELGVKRRLFREIIMYLLYKEEYLILAQYVMLFEEYFIWKLEMILSYLR